jgi:hypothetical protein
LGKEFWVTSARDEGKSLRPQERSLQQKTGYARPGRGSGRSSFKPLYYMYHGNDRDHRTKDYPIFLEYKRKMDQNHRQPPPQSPLREVNHIMQCPPLHPPYYPTYPPPFARQTHSSNHHGQPLSYYQSYHYATTNHTQSLSLPQITYSTPNNHPTKTRQRPICPLHLCYSYVSLCTIATISPPIT